MEPIPESTQADQLYGPFVFENADLLERLTTLGDRVRGISPDCVGLSLSLREHGEATFTVVASGADVALFDAFQYVEGGPCVDSVSTGTVIAHHGDDPLSEESWTSFAAAISAAGIASTLSLPLVNHGEVTGGFNLYGATSTTFDDRHDTIAEVLGAWAEGAVTNADLSFTSRDAARRAPQVLREATRMSLAAALVAQDQELTVAQAEEKLRMAAVHAGVALPSLVDGVIDVLS